MVLEYMNIKKCVKMFNSDNNNGSQNVIISSCYRISITIISMCYKTKVS